MARAEGPFLLVRTLGPIPRSSGEALSMPVRPEGGCHVDRAVASAFGGIRRRRGLGQLMTPVAASQPKSVRTAGTRVAEVSDAIAGVAAYELLQRRIDAFAA